MSLSESEKEEVREIVREELENAEIVVGEAELSTRIEKSFRRSRQRRGETGV
jgi:hypothetical protein